MKRLIAIVGGILILATGLLGSVSADNGPHGGYSAMTDKCAACHRAHTALGDKLLTNSGSAADRSAFCYSCHSGGTGAYTDVKNGLFVRGATVATDYEDTILPSGDRPLRGGGFDQVRMNAALTGTLTLAATSNHMITGGSNTVWGYGSITSTAYAGPTNVTLTCTNCHNPHGGAGAGNAATYRLLKGNNAANTPLFTSGPISANSTAHVPDESGDKTYYINANNTINGVNYANAYFGEHTSFAGNLYEQTTAWCGQCHTRYVADITGNPGHTDSGDALYKYRHGTNPAPGGNNCVNCHNNGFAQPNYPRPSCLNCHVAHGTGVRQGYWGGDVDWPDGATTPNGNSRSALLRLDNRGVCEACHLK